MTDITPSPTDHMLVADLSKRFGDYQALSDINMRIGRGRIVIIIGGSGAGKTTLMKILIGLDRPTSGNILIDGVDIAQLKRAELRQIRRKFGMVFQYSALLDSMNVFENLAFPLREHTNLRGKEIAKRVSEKLEALNLGAIESRMPSELSGGMKKRVGLARALMMEPEIIMYDEPTSGLDPLSARLVDEMIVDTRNRFGVTSVVISHDMAGALRVGDYIYVLSKGTIAAHGTPAELVATQTGIAKEFFDASGIAAELLIPGGEARIEGSS